MKRISFIWLSLLLATGIVANNAKGNNNHDKKVVISGYIQTQLQYGQKDASLYVGAKNENSNESFSRIGVRRGRVKLAYQEGLFSGVFQTDITEKGVALKDAYISATAPTLYNSTLRAGVFNRPFGNEIEYSSSLREAPERSDIFRALFPDERDLGAIITLQANETSTWSFLKLQAGLFAGNGINQETDSRKDFIGHLSANAIRSRLVNITLGSSYYIGGVYQSTEGVYRMTEGEFAANNSSNNIGKYAKREYFGFDTQIGIKSRIGATSIKAEYLFGTQPGSNNSSKSPNSSSITVNDIYIRSFVGGYVAFTQQIGQSPITFIAKYDWYDPNTKISGNAIGMSNTNATDIAYSTIGVGLLWQASSNIRMQAYYDFVNNEESENLTNYSANRKDNLFTVRLQYKF